MKKLLVTLFLSLLFLTHLYSQVAPFPKGPVAWTVKPKPYPTVMPIHYWTTGDTLITGKVYQKVYKHEPFNPYNNTNNSLNKYLSPAYFGAYLSDSLSGKVYFFPRDSSRAYLLYDFSLAIGDTLPLPHDLVYGRRVKCILISKDTVIVNGKSRKRQLYKPVTSFLSGNTAIVEGIGSYSGPFETIYGNGTLDQVCLLNCFFEGENYSDTTTFRWDKKCDGRIPLRAEETILKDFSLRPVPNPANCTFSFSYDIEKLRIISLSGAEDFELQCVSPGHYNISQLKDGIYMYEAEMNNQTTRGKLIVQH